MSRQTQQLSTAWRSFFFALGVVALLPFISHAPSLELTFGLALALPTYVAAHLVRVVRLIVLLGNDSPSLRSVTTAHCVSAAAGFLPAKTGEGARILALGKVLGSTWAAVRTVWIERTFDAAMIGFLGLALTPWLGLAWWLSMFFLLGTALILTVVPGNLRLGKRWLIQRYTTDWLVRTLPFLDRATREVERAQGHIEGRVTVLATLTAVIWALEMVAFVLIFGRWSEGTTLVTALSDGFLSASGSTATRNAYHLAVCSTALAIGLGALLGPAFRRRRSP